jgi:hypothetical protein
MLFDILCDIIGVSNAHPLLPSSLLLPYYYRMKFKPGIEQRTGPSSLVSSST